MSTRFDWTSLADKLRDQDLVRVLNVRMPRIARAMVRRTEFNVLDYGARGNGVSDDQPAFTAALTDAGTVGGIVRVPDPVAGKGYLLKGLLSPPANVSIVGSNKRSTRLIHGYNGVMIDFASGVTLEHLWIDGNGATYTGRGLQVSAGQGWQTVRSCQIIDFADYCIDFAHEAAGSQSYFEDLVTYQLVGTAVGQEAIIIRGTLTAAANPRTFIGIRTVGKRCIDTGPCNNLYIAASRIDGITWSDDSRGVDITGSRIAPAIATMTMKGVNHSITGSHIAPAITLGAGLASSCLSGNSYDNPTITDLSGTASNKIEQDRTSYTPTLAASGTAPDLGDGTLQGFYSRSGALIFYSIEFTFGTTTTLGTGELRFGLPLTRVNAEVLEGGTWIADDSGTRYVGSAQIPNNVGYVRLMRDTSGLVTATSPATWGTGDTIRISGSYYL